MIRSTSSQFVCDRARDGEVRTLRLLRRGDAATCSLSRRRAARVPLRVELDLSPADLEALRQWALGRRPAFGERGRLEGGVGGHLAIVGREAGAVTVALLPKMRDALAEWLAS